MKGGDRIDYQNQRRSVGPAGLRNWVRKEQRRQPKLNKGELCAYGGVGCKVEEKPESPWRGDRLLAKESNKFGG